MVVDVETTITAMVVDVKTTITAMVVDVETTITTMVVDVKKRQLMSLSAFLQDMLPLQTSLGSLKEKFQLSLTRSLDRSTAAHFRLQQR
jgi:hypothetical protein